MKKIQFKSNLLFIIAALVLLAGPAFGIDALHVTSTGNVGIGTTSPNDRFQVNSSRPILMGNNSGSGVYGSQLGFNMTINTGVVPNTVTKLGSTGQQGGAIITSDYRGNLAFQMYDAGTENASTINYAPQVMFTNGGKVGIGATIPAGTLDIKTSSGYELYFSGADNPNIYGVNSMYFLTGGASLSFGTGGINSQVNIINGNVGIGTTAPTQMLSVNGTAGKTGGGSWSSFSDIRLKTDIKVLINATELIAEYPKPIAYKWKNPEEHENQIREVIGLSAQDLEEVNPELVSEGVLTDSRDAELTDGKAKSIYFSNEFFALQLGAVQELIARVEALESENKIIKKELCKQNGASPFCK
jgi:hypothetical protein